MVVNCDSCKTEFKINLQQETIGKDKNGGDVVLHYFMCPNCNHRYNSYVTDSIFDEMRDKYRNLVDKVNKLYGKRVNPKLIEVNLKKAEQYKETMVRPYHAKLNEILDKQNAIAAGKEV